MGRKEGWKEEEGEGSVIDKSEPKRGSHSPPKLEAGQKMIHFLRYGARQVKHEEVELTILKHTHDSKRAAITQATSSNETMTALVLQRDGTSDKFNCDCFRKSTDYPTATASYFQSLF